MRSVEVGWPLLGADPEFFFASPAGQIIGAEDVIDKNGLKYDDKAVGTGSNNTTTYVEGGGKVVIDGVQAEMHPHPNTCRANIIFEVAECFRTIKKQLEAKGVGLNLERTVVEVDKAVLDRLSDEAKKLGCMPSKNAYGLGSADLEAVNASEYRTRSAGGHIHIGDYSATDGHETLAKLCDYLVGNTCVLMDRDPLTAERRKLYGRAGEFRTPKITKGHGADFEYRTLSNFWLRDHRLMALALGLCRLALAVKASGQSEAVFAAVPEADIVKAINENDLTLARRNFDRLTPIFEGLTTYWSAGSRAPLGQGAMDKFEYFLWKGLDYWFPQAAVLDTWTGFREGHGNGWENFLGTKVATEMATDTAYKAFLAAPPVPVAEPQPVEVVVPAAPVPGDAPPPTKPARAYQRGPGGRFAPKAPVQVHA